MSAMSLRLPNSLHEAAKELAEREGISVNQLVATALAEKLSALMTVEYLQARAKRGGGGRPGAAPRGKKKGGGPPPPGKNGASLGGQTQWRIKPMNKAQKVLITIA